MKKKFKLGVIGAGFMSSAIINGALSSKILNSSEIFVSDLSDDALNRMTKLGIETTKDNYNLVSNSEFCLFAIKPQNCDEVLTSIKGADCQKFISIMAGVKKNKIKNVLGNVSVARCMPNTPCAIGKGAVGIDLTDYTDLNDKEFVCNLFSSLAQVEDVEEDLLGAVTGISGSAPAYFYLFLKGIVESGVEQGLTYEKALNLAVNTMIGAGEMVKFNTDKSLDQLIGAVCSKGGTTIEAIKTYEDGKLNELTQKAIKACVKRSKELENL